MDALDDGEFARLIAPLGPFEHAPRLAVAVSGGPDSLALCLLATAWAGARGGEVTALIVDHGLRAASAAEARQAGAWLGQRGISHHVLCWHGPKPTAGIQAAARAARYRLLADWCRANEVLHLLLGHHRDDQAETVALRAARQSGPDGLAGMAAVREIVGLRLLRPLLAVPKQRLVATLRAAGQPWIEDPSNLAERFARGRLRRRRAPAAGPGAGAGEGAAEARAALDRRTAAWLAGVARIDPAGFLVWPHAAFDEAPIEIARRALQQALAAIGGSDYPPRSVRLGRLLEVLRPAAGFSGRTLAGCRILRCGPDLLICREPAAIAPPRRLVPNAWQEWDGRFLVRWRAEADDRAGCGPTLRALGPDGWRQGRHLPPTRTVRLPHAVRTGLPSFWQDDRLLAVPGLDLSTPLEAGWAFALRFRPRRPLAGPPFIATVHRTNGRLVTTPLLRSGDSLC